MNMIANGITTTIFSSSRDEPFSLYILRLKCYANKRVTDVTIYVRIHCTVRLMAQLLWIGRLAIANYFHWHKFPPLIVKNVFFKIRRIIDGMDVPGESRASNLRYIKVKKSSKKSFVNIFTYVILFNNCKKNVNFSKKACNAKSW